MDFAKEIALLEPFGTGNRRPLFATEVYRVDAKPLREGSPHLSFASPVIDLIYFNGERNTELLRASVKKTVVFEPNISTYAGRDSLKGYVKSFEVDVQPSRELGLELFAKNLKNLKSDNVSEKASIVTCQGDKGTVKKFKLDYKTLDVVEVED